MTVKQYIDSRNLPAIKVRTIIKALFGTRTELTEEEVGMLDQEILRAADTPKQIEGTSTPVLVNPYTDQIRQTLGDKTLREFSALYKVVLQQQSYEVLNYTSTVIGQTESIVNGMVAGMYQRLAGNLHAVHQEMIVPVAPVSLNQPLSNEDYQNFLTEFETL